MKNEGAPEPYAEEAGEAGASAASAPKEAVHRYRLLATMVQGTAAAPPETCQPYRTVGETLVGARKMLHNHRVLRIAIVEDRIPPQLVEGIGR